MKLGDWEAGGAFVELSLAQAMMVLQIIGKGWNLALEQSALTAGLHERYMTRWLIPGMRRSVPDSGVIIQRGTETADAAVPDICISFQRIREDQDEHEPHAVVECKRVSGDDAGLCRLYVVNGIDRFATGKYGAKRAHGFMAAYVTSGTPGEAADGVNRYLRKHREGTECLVDEGRPVETFSVWVSSHRRPHENPIRLRHLFLEFCQRK